MPHRAPLSSSRPRSRRSRTPARSSRPTPPETATTLADGVVEAAKRLRPYPHSDRAALSCAPADPLRELKRPVMLSAARNDPPAHASREAAALRSAARHIDLPHGWEPGFSDAFV